MVSAVSVHFSFVPPTTDHVNLRRRVRRSGGQGRDTRAPDRQTGGPARTPGQGEGGRAQAQGTDTHGHTGGEHRCHASSHWQRSAGGRSGCWLTSTGCPRPTPRGRRRTLLRPARWASGPPPRTPAGAGRRGGHRGGVGTASTGDGRRCGGPAPPALLTAPTATAAHATSAAMDATRAARMARTAPQTPAEDPRPTTRVGDLVAARASAFHNRWNDLDNERKQDKVY